mgnify:CR=1 FL=1
MKRIRMNKTKLVIAVCIAIPSAIAAVLLPRAIKTAKRSKYACV